MSPKFRFLRLFTLPLMTSLLLGLGTPTLAKESVEEEELLKTEKSEGIWSIEFLDKDTLLFSEKAGKIKIFNLKTKKVSEVKNPPPSSVWGQGGLMDLHLHPDFKKNHIVYATYTKKIGKDFTTVLSQSTLKDASFTPWKELLVANNANQNQQHFGSRIVNDEKGFLYFTIGDRGERDLAQKLEADQGKVHRLNLDGSLPEDNPFVKNNSARKTIWTLGHRNPQGLVYDFKTKTLWLQEHGPRGGDEINVITKGLNYGWPVITYGREYYGPRIGEEKKEGMEQPVYYYVPSIAPSGLEIHQGDLFSGALRQTHINRLKMSSQNKPIREERLLEKLGERIRDVKASPDGQLYFSTDSGKIFRLNFKK